MNDIQTSRFFTFDDPQLNPVILKLPQVWWSRPYEYAWAASWINQNHVVLDAACGICHPFKYYLCNLCKVVFACDFDKRLLSDHEIIKDMFNVFGEEASDFPAEYLKKPILSCQDIANTSYPDGQFDRITCISVLEHLKEEKLLKTLLEFKRLLKENGLIVATIDYPYLNLEAFNRILSDAGLAYAGETNCEIPNNALKTALFPEFPGGLYSFRALIKKGRD